MQVRACIYPLPGGRSMCTTLPPALRYRTPPHSTVGLQKQIAMQIGKARLSNSMAVPAI